MKTKRTTRRRFSVTPHSASVGGRGGVLRGGRGSLPHLPHLPPPPLRHALPVTVAMEGRMPKM